MHSVPYAVMLTWKGRALFFWSDSYSMRWILVRACFRDNDRDAEYNSLVCTYAALLFANTALACLCIILWEDIRGIMNKCFSTPGFRFFFLNVYGDFHNYINTISSKHQKLQVFSVTFITSHCLDAGSGFWNILLGFRL